MKKVVTASLCLTLLVGCAGWERDCNSYSATQLGADWVVTQIGMDGKPFNCWQLKGVGITNETASDGIFWNDEAGLIHLSGWYNRIQVEHGAFAKAGTAIGVDITKCKNGRYE
jgi:hypothetical protein